MFFAVLVRLMYYYMSWMNRTRRLSSLSIPEANKFAQGAIDDESRHLSLWHLLLEVMDDANSSYTDQETPTLEEMCNDPYFR